MEQPDTEQARPALRRWSDAHLFAHDTTIRIAFTCQPVAHVYDAGTVLMCL